jgi:hypothetical protein
VGGRAPKNCRSNAFSHVGLSCKKLSCAPRKRV